MRALSAASTAVTLVVIALVLAAGLEPPVAALTRRGLRRGAAVAVVAVGFLVGIAAFFAALVPPLVGQGQQLVANTPGYLQRLQDRSSFVGHLNKKYHLLAQLERYVAGGGTRLLSDLVGLGVAILGAVTSAVAVLVLTVYFLAGLPRIEQAVIRTFPVRHRDRAGLVTREVVHRVGGYVLGNLLTSVVAGAGTVVFLEVVGVPYPLALGLFVALLDLVPVIGSTVAGAVVTLVALTVSVPVALGTLAYYVAYRLAEDYLLVPRIMRRTVKVSPGVTIVALIVGGALLGIVGALLAIPAAAVADLLLSELIWPRLDRA